MSRLFRVPTEAELPGLIRAAFDQAPGPDAERLEMIFERLLAKSLRPERRLAPWWAIVLMGSGAALAAWGVHEIIESASEQPQREYAMPPEMLFEVESNESQQDNRDPEESASIDAKADNERPAPVIYQRERF